jgi:hypothetical protein
MKRKAKAEPRVQTRLVDKKAAFLAAFVACANLTRAAESVGMDRGQHYDWLRDDRDYAEAYAAALPQAGQTLKDRAVDWAMTGIFEPVFYQGKLCYQTRSRKLVTLENGDEIDEAAHAELQKRLGVEVKIVARREVEEAYGPPLGVQRMSEGLMGRLLKAFLPAEFGDKLSAELTGKDGGPMEIVAKLTAARARVKKPEA